MEDKRLKEKFTDEKIQELRFTKEDRNKVFDQINKTDKEFNAQKNWLVSISKLAPLTVSLFIVGLCIFLFVPSILQGNVINETTETNSNDTIGAVSQNDKDFTALLTVKDENNRIPINLLLTYSKDKRTIKILSIPRDTYAPILDKDGTTSYDKLTFAYVHGLGGAKNVKNTVSKLFDLSIDYYAVMDLKSLSTAIDSVNGIDYDLHEDIKVKAISKVAFEFKKGTIRLQGEEVAALLMDATVGRSLDVEDQLNLINAVIDQTINVLPQTQLEEFTSKIEGNMPFEQLLNNKVELPSIQSVSLLNGMKDEMIDGAFYITFEKDFLNSVSEELTTFN